MSKEGTNKDFNKMLNNNKNMPKIVEIKDEAGIKKWGGQTMVIAPPLAYDALIKKVEYGSLVTTDELRKQIAKIYNVEITCPLTAGIFINIVAWASYQRETDVTPYWRVLKSDGQLNPKYPESISLQRSLLEQEGHEIIVKGKNKDKYYVKDFLEKVITFD